MTMTTTIQISGELQQVLLKRKLFDAETYEDVLWDLVEDSLELSEETKRNIALAEKDVAEGKVYTHEQVKKKLGL